MLENKTHSNSYLQLAYAKYGCDNFVFSKVEIIVNVTDLLSAEQKYIDFYDFNTLYNLCPTAGSMLGRKFLNRKNDYQITEDHRFNLSKSQRDKYTDLPQGVTFSVQTHKYLVQIWYRGRHIVLGSFKNLEDARNIYLDFKADPEEFIRTRDKNIKKKKSNFSSKHHGVSFIKSKKRFRATVKKRIRGKLKVFFQKLYKTEEEAYLERCNFIKTWNENNEDKLR